MVAVSWQAAARHALHRGDAVGVAVDGGRGDDLQVAAASSATVIAPDLTANFPVTVPSRTCAWP
jgi:hypothetical protein